MEDIIRELAGLFTDRATDLVGDTDSCEFFEVEDARVSASHMGFVVELADGRKVLFSGREI